MRNGGEDRKIWWMKPNILYIHCRRQSGSLASSRTFVQCHQASKLVWNMEKRIWSPLCGSWQKNLDHIGGRVQRECEVWDMEHSWVWGCYFFKEKQHWISEATVAPTSYHWPTWEHNQIIISSSRRSLNSWEAGLGLMCGCHCISWQWEEQGKQDLSPR